MKTIPLFDLKKQFLPLKQQLLQRWEKILDDTAFTSGEYIELFEKNFAKFLGAKYALGVRSGTASLVVSLLAAGVKTGDEVITTPATFSATADAVVLAGAKPVFVDVQPADGNIDPKKIAQKITKKTKAILIVHLYGVPCDMKPILAIARQNKLVVIEDASHAHGSKYRGKSAGTLGLVGCFSLYPSKSLGAAGNAGVIVSDNKAFIKRAEMYSHHGIADKRQKYLHSLSGYNELLDNVQAAVLDLRLKGLKRMITQKQKIAKRFNRVFQAHRHPGMKWDERDLVSIYVYAVQIKNRSKFQELMKNNGIETGVYYPLPLHLQKSMAHLRHKKGDFPVAEKFMDQTISLPLYSELSEKQLKRIEDTIEEYLTKYPD